MKRIILLVMLAFSMFSNASVFAGNAKDDDDPIIVVGNTSGGKDSNHRTSIPLECCYSKTSQAFAVNVFYPMADFEMTVESVDGSLSINVQLQGTTGVQTVPMALSSGVYRVSIVLSGGNIVSGFLNL